MAEQVYLSIFDKTTGTRKTSYTILGQIHGKNLDELKEKASADYPDDYAVEQTEKEYSEMLSKNLGWNGSEYIEISEEPTEEEKAQQEAVTAENELREISISAMMTQLSGGGLESSKAQYTSTLNAISDTAAILIPSVFPEWDGNSVSYTVGTRVTYKGTLYKVLQAHTSQSTWAPDVAPSLFAKVLTSDTGEPLPWEQPDSANPYMKGDKVTYNGKTYESVIDNNVWSPDDYPAGWKEVNA